MIANFLLGLFVVILVFLLPNKKLGLKFAFALITIFLAIRYQWGNDYPSYLNQFNILKGYSNNIFDFTENEGLYGSVETGWIVLNRFFGAIGVGFFGMVAILTVFENLCVYNLIRKHVKEKYYWVALFFLVLGSSMCMYASMMRQYLAMCFFLIFVDLMIEKRVKLYWLWAIVIILLGTTIHRSCWAVFITIPFFYLHIDFLRWRTWIYVIGIIYVIWMILGEKIVAVNLPILLENYDEFSYYQVYLENSGSSNELRLGFLYKYVIFVVWLVLLPEIDREKQPFVFIILFSYFFDVLIGIAPIALRLTYYFSMLTLITWPIMFSLSKNKPVLQIVVALQMAVSLKSFFSFFNYYVWVDACKEYHTIFEAPYWI